MASLTAGSTAKIAAGIVIAMLVANMILFALKKIQGLVFWLVIIIGALIAYFILPKFASR
ncbi:hypothetical protein HYU19_03230 [Candidatus Woesearchaeota archaeon]|nr:hypothetical protein [Candidatus Woesearchaeota archaeon]